LSLKVEQCETMGGGVRDVERSKKSCAEAVAGAESAAAAAMDRMREMAIAEVGRCRFTPGFHS